MIEVQNLSKSYTEGKMVLDHISFRIDQGEIFCMFGANGAGKTTTINLLLDFTQPTEGKVLIDGIDVTQEPLRAKQYVAYVSENVMLYDNFSAYQNIDYFAKLAGKAALSRSDYAALLDQVGLDRSQHQMRIRNYSKGMRQKLGIAIAMVKDAPNILLDEPTSGLDPKAGAEFLELLGSLRADGKSILMSTHDIFRAKTVADRIGFLKEGRLVMMRTREELEHEDLSGLYIEYMQSEQPIEQGGNV
jgi:ABC-2 type transport system ATP-binding protein